MNSWTLQQAIYTQLTNDATLMAMISGVFDETPRDQAFPYVTIGDMTERPNDSLVEMISEQTFVIHSWSRVPGNSEVKQIMDRLDFTLHRARLNVSKPVLCLREFAQTMHDVDGLTRHGIQRYRVQAGI